MTIIMIIIAIIAMMIIMDKNETYLFKVGSIKHVLETMLMEISKVSSIFDCTLLLQKH